MLRFDSCEDNPGLVLNKSHWQGIENDLKFKRLVNTHFTIWQCDHWPYKKATVSKISIGGKTIKNAEVLIKNEKDMTGKLSMFGLAYFQDTTIVLDYVNNLFWIKK